MSGAWRWSNDGSRSCPACGRYAWLPSDWRCAYRFRSIQVGVTAEVSYHGRHAMPPEATGMAAALYLYRDTVQIVAGRYQAQHPRYLEKGTVSRQPEHRAAHLAAISGQRAAAICSVSMC